MSKQLQFSTDARTKLLAGAEKLAHAVRITMGPKGRNVALAKKYGLPVTTNDGVTIAREISLPDPYEDMGAQMVKEVANKTNDVAGDGTTTATVLAVELIRNGLPLVREGANPVLIKQGMDTAVKHAVDYLHKIAKKVTTKEEKAQVASISAADPKVGDLIAEVMEKVGKDGVVTVEASQTMGLSYECVDGMQFDSGFISQHMVTDVSRMEAVVTDAVILITDEKISNVKDLIPLLEEVVKGGKRIVIIADDIEGDALATLVMNKVKGSLQSLAIKAPSFGERRKAILQDIAILTGGKFISEEMGLKVATTKLADLGTVGKVISSKDATVLVNGGGDKEEFKNRITRIKSELKIAVSDYEKETLSRRLAKLTGGVAVIRVGATTDVELTEKKHRVEDAVSATRAAIEEGIVPGGGMALLRAVSALEAIKNQGTDQKTGIDIVRKTLSAPIKQIIENAGKDWAEILSELRTSKNTNIGYDADLDKVCDMFEAGIIDPTKVTRSALENANSIAALFLTLGAAVTDIPEPTPVTNNNGQ